MRERKVCVITGARAEYGLLFPIIKKIQASDDLQLQLIVTTMHLSEEFGNTYKQIETDGFIIDEKIENLLSSDSKASVVKSSGLAMILLSDALQRLQPDLMLLLGDRFETHAAATASLLMNIPIAHVHGGEMTEGAVDEQMRHAITKMSYLHFTSTDSYRQRVIQMGEDPSRVVNSGAPGIDNILSMKLISKEALEQELGWNFGEKSILFTYHPETLGVSDPTNDVKSILSCIEQSGANILFTYANADGGGRLINQNIEYFCQINPEKYKVVKSLGQLKYLSAMKHIDILVGNTSSGIIEAASFHKPVVNIGDRQKGRLQSGNVMDCTLDTLVKSIEYAFSNTFQKECLKVNNIYGSGNAAGIIIETILNVTLSNRKKFCDMSML